MNHTSPEMHDKVKLAIMDQLHIVINHVKSEGRMDAAFVREHALSVVQLAESILDPAESPYRGSSSSEVG